MAFSTYSFIFIFLPLALIVYYALPKSLRNLTLLIFSLLFYGWGSPAVLLILIASSFVDYQLSLKMQVNRSKRLLFYSVALNVAVLCYYKYSNFAIEQLNLILANLGSDQVGWAKVILPAGISFFTFEKISYLVDVYRGTATPTKTFRDYLLFVSLFPHLIAGPILKYHDLYQQIVARQHSWELFNQGWRRFCFGLAKKVLIADELGKVADQIFAMDSLNLSLPLAWLGVVCYALQIYFDFSGYSDMAIGMGRMFGFRLIENFNWPYISQSISEFWRRWHISLGNWMREYLYIPLGGNRTGLARSYLNLVIVFSLSGLWHGASWTFICWGLFHGLFLVLDRVFWVKLSEQLPKLINISITFLIVLLGWVLFRSQSLGQAISFYNAMFNFSSLTNTNFYLLEIIHNRGIFVLFIALIFSFAGSLRFFNNLQTKLSKETVALNCLSSLAAILLLILSTIAIAANGYSAFLYYQF
jgi:alginate O-acetyltransferase complex protein AlgI